MVLEFLKHENIHKMFWVKIHSKKKLVLILVESIIG